MIIFKEHWQCCAIFLYAARPESAMGEKRNGQSLKRVAGQKCCEEHGGGRKGVRVERRKKTRGQREQALKREGHIQIAIADYAKYNCLYTRKNTRRLELFAPSPAIPPFSAMCLDTRATNVNSMNLTASL